MRRGRDRVGRAALALTLVLGLAIARSAAAAPTVDARAIVDRVDQLLRGDSSEGEVTMSVVTRRWTRTLTLMVWGPGVRTDGRPGSEYGAAPRTLYAALKVYF